MTRVDSSSDHQVATSMAVATTRTRYRCPCEQHRTGLTAFTLNVHGVPRYRAAEGGARMIPLSDGITARRFPIVNVALIAANFAVFLFYELPEPRRGSQPCGVLSVRCQQHLSLGRLALGPG